MTKIIADRIKETSTTVGTGALTLAGAPSGYRRFSAVCAVGDTIPYAAVAQAANEWEVGLGTYTAANVLTRTTVLASSNAGAAVGFSGSTLDVWCNLDATRAGWIRERPANGAAELYVRADGSDSNTGQVNTAGGAFLTLARAFQALEGIDHNGVSAYIEIAAGTFTSAIVVPELVNCPSIDLYGAGATTILSPASGDCLMNRSSTPLAVNDVKLVSAAGAGLHAEGRGRIDYGGVTFGAASFAHLWANNGGTLLCTGDYAISGSSPYHLLAQLGSRCIDDTQRTVTITGTPAFAGGFAVASDLSLIRIGGNTYSGAATGKRYSATLNSVIDTGAAITLPGSTAGSVATGGQYA